MPDLNESIGVFQWQPKEQFGETVIKALRDNGHYAIGFSTVTPEDLARIQTLIIYGPWGSIEPLMRANRKLPDSQRPRIVLWQSEQFPNPTFPTWFWRVVGRSRSNLESLAYRLYSEESTQLSRFGKLMTSRLHRYRYFGDGLRYFRNPSKNVMVLWSDWTAKLLHNRGLEVAVAYMGYHPDFGRDMGLVRDIPVLWLGKLGSARRARLLDDLRSKLRKRGLEVLVVDGIEHPYVFGEERTRLLNRAKVIINLLREPWDNTSMRFFLAAGNKTLVIGEPMLPHIPLKPGYHYVESEPSSLPERIEYFVNHDFEREVLVERSYSLVSHSLTMANSLESIICPSHEQRQEMGE